MGVEIDSTKETIDAAFRAAAKKLHPDRKGGSNPAMQALTASRDVLFASKIAQSQMRALPPAPPSIPIVPGADGVRFIVPTKEPKTGVKKTVVSKGTQRAKKASTLQVSDLEERLEKTVKSQRPITQEILEILGKVTGAKPTSKIMDVIRDQPRNRKVGRVA